MNKNLEEVEDGSSLVLAFKKTKRLPTTGNTQTGTPSQTAGDTAAGAVVVCSFAASPLLDSHSAQRQETGRSGPVGYHLGSNCV